MVIYMYESPIEMIQTEIKTQFEDDCLKAVQSFGFIVNKEELIKALIYDRKQYDKGYSDGYNMAIDDFMKKSEYLLCENLIYQKMEDIAEQLKTGVVNGNL